MEIAFYGRGPVADRCREVLSKMDVYERIGPVRGVDLGVFVHWPYVLKKKDLQFAKLGCVNVHNSYLPWNRGAHSCTWAIVDQTPHGATMHWMDEGIDTGPILYQERVEVSDADTAHSLYQKTADAEVRVFTVGMELLLAGNYRKLAQPQHNTFHRKKDFDRLVRALTTSDCKVIREA